MPSGGAGHALGDDDRLLAACSETTTVAFEPSWNSWTIRLASSAVSTCSVAVSCAIWGSSVLGLLRAHRRRRRSEHRHRSGGDEQAGPPATTALGGCAAATTGGIGRTVVIPVSTDSRSDAGGATWVASASRVDASGGRQPSARHPGTPRGAVELRAFEIVERVDGVRAGQRMHVGHDATPIVSRSRMSPSRIRVLAVPTGRSSMLATSVCGVAPEVGQLVPRAGPP